MHLRPLAIALGLFVTGFVVHASWGILAGRPEAAPYKLSATAQTASRPTASRGDILPFVATERTLANGLKVVVVPTGFPNLVSIDIPVQTGSRNEVEAGKSGFAHFFEHLMFRGTPNTPPERYRDLMRRAGARENASTGDDRTHYYAT